jgi:DNA polymerase-3 subunit delta'
MPPLRTDRALNSTPADRDDDIEAPPPRETEVLFGHAQAEQALLRAYRGARIPHAWLISGPKGIGKATLAYRMARFVLAHPDPSAPEVRAAQTLAVDPAHPVARRVAAQAQGDLAALERTLGDTGKLRTEIAVEQVRDAVRFFATTAGEGGWRIAIVDSVDELNRAGANALLKVLEEPPPRSLLLLVNHAAGRVMPTIRSRCRVLALRPLGAEDVALAAAHALGRSSDDAAVSAAASAADGSVARALALIGGDALALRRQILDLLAALPRVDGRALHALGDALSGTEPQTLALFLDTVNDWLSARLRAMPGELAPMARLAEAWEKINQAARDVDTYNLDRKPLVFAVFGLLAESAPG